tara:strand:+ start:1316 stop:3100 length:1785 start_codon:yes stop_codon:yes gene_type:complete
MADNLATFPVPCQGGLLNNVDPLTHGGQLAGSAYRMINYEPSLNGGYRRISGYTNAYGELTGLANSPVLGLHVSADINQGIFGCRKPTSGNNYLHWYNHYYDVTLASGEGSGFTVGETVTGVVSSGDSTAVAATGTVISKTADAIVVDFGKLPDNIFATGNVLTGGDSSATGTVQSTPTVKGWQAVTTAGSPTMTGVTQVRFESFNWSAPKFALVDGVNPAAVYDGTTYTQITHAQAPTDPTLVAAFNNHLFLAGDPAEPYNIYFSAPIAETDFDPANGAGVINVGFKVVQIKAFRDQLFIFGTNNIKRLVGDNQANFVLQNVTNNLGCIAPDSVVEFNGEIIFLAPDGLRPVSGTDRIGDIELATLSKQVQSIFEDYVANEDLVTIRTIVVKKKSQFRLFFADQNSLGLIAGIRRSGQGGVGFEFGQLVGIEVNCGDSGYIGDEEFVIHGDSNGFVYRQEDGNNFNGDDIFSLYQTPYVYMEDPEVRKTIHSVNTYLRAEGVLTVVMALEYDYGDTDVTNPTDFSFTTVGAAAYYDKALYDAAEIYDGNPSPIRSTNVSGSGKSVSIKYVTNSDQPSHTIQAYSITYGVGDRR